MSLATKIKFGLVSLLVGLAVFSSAQAATLELALEKGITSSKDDIVVLVTINSEGQDVNTAQASISFPANLLSVNKVDRTSSIFSFWLEEPSFDNTKGTIRFVGGSTSGFTGASLKVMSISFRVKGSGSGRLGITDGAITASDGTGSNVYTTAKGLDINIPATADFQAVKVEQARRAAVTAKELPALLGFDIPFYPDQTKWNNRSASFQVKWKISPDTSQAAMVLNDKPNTIPAASAEALTGSRIFPALKDGVSYLHLRLANNIGWSETLHYRIAVDTTPPAAFKITSDVGLKTGEPRPTISFASSDLASGVNNYVVRLDGDIATTTSATSYKFSPLLPGIHQVMVQAVDNAGNSISQTVALEILPIESPKIAYVNNRIVVNEGSIIAGGTALPGVDLVAQVQNSKNQIVAEQVVPVDSKGNWNVTIIKALTSGDYKLLATARDEKMASSFPVVSEIIKARPRPILVIGNLEITPTWFFVLLILALLGSFSAGWLAYRNWRGQLGRRVVVAERDVLNILSNLDKDLSKLLKNLSDGDIDKTDMAEIEYNLKKMKDYLDKSRRYVVDNIKEIND
ncbi:MAG: hypothetical protein WCV68_01555 [Candidatus Paceibacterota bacterium]|jgi:hypothetical protein